MRIETVLDIARHNNGIITTAMVTKAGISRGILKFLSDKGMLEKVSRGVYILPDGWEDEIYNLQARYKKGIISGETALYLYDLTDRTPCVCSMTFPASYNVSHPKAENIRCTQCKSEWYNIGIQQVKTTYGNTVTAYSPERTLCDILRNKKTDISIVTDAFKKYVLRQERNIPLLMEYAELFGVQGRVRTYFEVLI